MPTGKKPPPCTKCGSAEVVPILYGEPTFEAAQAAERGELAIGGCSVMGRGLDLEWHCRRCDADFSTPETRRWKRLRDELAQCRICHGDENELDLADPGSRPLFCRTMPKRTDILFILEAPNRDDTFDPDKGYLTYDRETDPSGRFFRELFVEELGEPIERAAVTNSVLCLPRRKNGKHPVTAGMMRACSCNLQMQITVLDPLIVAPLGTTALRATRLIEDHGLAKITEAVAREVPWCGRVLFPLYHTGMMARNGPSGRKAELQREDWRRLRRVLERFRNGERAPPPQ